ncbi:SAP domain-containing ribonucleoprotein [Myotis brandtii]|uniref:SAP domain-containing ribonucleoprotein n=1 Tax=Myotis brandtii TaxID=109478 RepID=S7NB00_MYOBR|nr:SAP domain-containing ribonucleoprotein [Myotis brandtii]
MAAETVELHKLKLAELKQECLARGLETKGIKQDLINRLQAYLEEHAEEEANEEDVLGDETEEEEPKPIELPVKEEEPPEKTVDVFGISSVPSKGLSSDTKPMVNLDKLKERAQRFGLNVSSISRKFLFMIQSGSSNKIEESEDDEKLKKRKERFGIVTSSAGTGTTEDTEAKKRKRAERFGIA